MLDPFCPSALANRPEVGTLIKEAIASAFAVVPDGRTSAIVAIAESDHVYSSARLHAAIRVGTRWQVGAQVGWSTVDGVRGQVAVMASW